MEVIWSDPRIAAGAVAAALLLGALVWIVYQRRLTPEEKERRRRLALNRWQRTAEGLVLDAGPELIHYQYELRGVAYSASQDVSSLRHLLPPDPGRLIGPVHVKYDPRNPANSIILCEEWSGLPAITVRKEPQDADRTEPMEKLGGGCAAAGAGRGAGSGGE
ncbi:MAG: hypothetical protein NZR01_01945 [Bryobacteraceae bacterium]|nr:hypothetical protein [Bryobacteraceae bacterium]